MPGHSVDKEVLSSLPVTQLTREMLGSNVFAHKKGSPAHGLAWEAIVSTLNGLESQEF